MSVKASEIKQPQYPWIIDFDNQYNETEPVFDFAYNDKHEVIVVYQGEKNIQAEIDSHFDECDMNVLLENLRNGDTSMDAMNGQFADISDMPDNLQDMAAYAEKVNSKLTKVVDDEKSIFFGMTGAQISALSPDDIKALLAAKDVKTTTPTGDNKEDK